MRTSRLLTGAALAFAVAGLAAAPGYAADGTTGGSTLDLRPRTAAPGATIAADTSACGAGSGAAGDASAVGAGAFPLAPDTGRREASGRFEVPASAQPGTYEIVVTCSGGSRAAGDLVVSLTAAESGTRPSGHVNTGVGGTLGSDPVQTAAGVAALAVAAAGGTWLLYRRARGDGI